jgi:CRP/FNR family cyclic AMP-dependent transcriptional regulator
MKTTSARKLETEPRATAAPAEAIASPANGLPRPLYGLVSEQPFFKGLRPEQIQLLADSAVIMQFGADEKVFGEGDQANRFYIILEGRISLEAETEDRRTLPVKTLGPGEDLGWSWLFPPYLMHFAARTLEPTRLILFYGTRLRQQCEADHDLGYELMKRVAAVMMERLQATRQRWLSTQAPKLPVNWEQGIY